MLDGVQAIWDAQGGAPLCDGDIVMLKAFLQKGVFTRDVWKRVVW